MSKIKAVLLVPAKGDPHGLLSEGPCGASPPTASRYRCEDTRRWRWLPGRHLDAPLLARVEENSGGGLSGPYALVLAWDEKPVAEGCFRASEGSRYLSYTSVRNIVDTVLRGKVHGDQPVLEERGTLVLLDADGREVSDVSD